MADLRKKFEEFKRVFSAYLTEFENPDHFDCFRHGYRIGQQDLQKEIDSLKDQLQWSLKNEEQYKKALETLAVSGHPKCGCQDFAKEKLSE